MQPYFLPYIGYFQLIDYCDVFVVYDDIQYSKKGWINRNQMLYEGSQRMFTLPLQSDSDYLDVRDRSISPVFNPEKLMAQFSQAYRKAPYWEETSGLIRNILQYPNKNLFEFIINSITEVASYLHINTTCVASSTLGLDAKLQGQDRVLTICEALGASQYINPIGGRGLYTERMFQAKKISLRFLKSNLSNYPQGGGEFLSALSIVDVLAWCGLTDTKYLLATDFQVLNQQQAVGA